MPKLSIVITCLDDPDIHATLQSIHDTAPEKCEIIVVNDRSTLIGFPDSPYFKVINNSHRCGVGPSRTIGVHHSTGDYVLIIDSHMRFKPGWYEEVMRRVEGRERTIHCAVCAGLDSKNMDVNNPKGRYYGARFELHGEDTNIRGRYRVMEGIWNKNPPEDDAEISICMGAAYAMHRDWFLKLDALRFLRSWGQDEILLSIKSYLAGGDVRLMRNVEIGHVFLSGEEKPPYKTPVGHLTFNKLFTLLTLIPDQYHDILLEKLIFSYGGGELSTGQKMISESWPIIETEKARNVSIFKHSFQWYADRHGIALNGKK